MNDWTPRLIVVFVLLLGTSECAADAPLPAGAVARFGEIGSKDSGISAVTFSPDGRILATGEANWIRLWDVAQGRELRRLEKLPFGVYSLAFSPDGSWLASGGFDRIVRIWEVSTGKEIRQWKAHLASVEWVAFSPDGTQLVSAGKEQNIQLWDAATGRAIRGLSGHAGWVFCAVFTPDGKQLISGGRDMTIRIWDVASGNQVRLLTQPAGKNLIMAAKSPTDLLLVTLSPDGQNLVSAGSSQGLLLWSVKSGNVIRPFGETRKAGAALDEAEELVRQMNARGSNIGQRIYCAAFSPDGRTVAAGQNEAVVLWETASGKKRGQFVGHRGVISSVAFGPDGKTLASGSRDGTAMIWDLLSPGKKAGQSSPAMDEKQLEATWDHLADSDAGRAYQAVCALIAHPKETVQFLETKLKPVSVNFQQIDRYIHDLDDNSFEVRKTATEELGKMEEVPEEKLRKALAGKPSLEIRRRIDEILQEIERIKLEPSGRQLQPVRATEVLEHIGTAEAKSILDRLTQGTPGLRLTEEAKGSLERLKKKANK